MILMIDNYDSFTYNIVQYLGELRADPVVKRNDEVSIKNINELRPERIVISPGPGRPEEAGISVDIVRCCGQSIPILVVCLGHQAIGHAFGASIQSAPELLHGKSSDVRHDGKGLFKGIANPFSAGRYHSLTVAKENLPDELVVTASTASGETIMGLRHRVWPVHGVQFHPESILTGVGHSLLTNFMEC